MNLSSVPAAITAVVVGLLMSIPIMVAGDLLLGKGSPDAPESVGDNSFVSGSVDYGGRR